MVRTAFSWKIIPNFVSFSLAFCFVYVVVVIDFFYANVRNDIVGCILLTAMMLRCCTLISVSDII